MEEQVEQVEQSQEDSKPELIPVDITDIADITDTAKTKPSFCVYCDAAGDTDIPAVAICIACREDFCKTHQSRQSILHCINCYKDVVIEDKIIHKAVSKYSMKLDKLVTKIKTCRQITFDGESWRKQTNLIKTLTDHELHDMLELTRGSIILMEHEILTRNIEDARKHALKDASYKVAAVAAGSTASSTKIKTSVTLKLSTTDESGKTKLNVSSMKKAGFTPELLKSLIAQLEKK